MALAVVLVLSGAVLLGFAPDRFVAGSAGLATRWGVSRVVIGAVVMGFGTSTPELLVSGFAAARDEPEVGVGNVNRIEHGEPWPDCRGRRAGRAHGGPSWPAAPGTAVDRRRHPRLRAVGAERADPSGRRRARRRSRGGARNSDPRFPATSSSWRARSRNSWPRKKRCRRGVRSRTPCSAWWAPWSAPTSS